MPTNTTIHAIQGGGIATTVTANPVAGFNGTERLVARVTRGDHQTAVLTVTPKWSLNQTQGSYNKVDVFIQPADTLTLAPGAYTVIVALADSSMALASLTLIIYPGPGGTVSPFRRCLVTPATAMMYTPDMTQPQIDALPFSLVSATHAVERHCGRPLAMDTYDHFVRPTGGIFRFRLKAKPVVEVLRVSADVGPGVMVTNNGGFSNATVRTILAQPGRLLDIDSLVFTTTHNGQQTAATLNLSDFAVFGDLATGINALGYGWVAQSGVPYLGMPTKDAFGTPETRNALNQWIWVHTHTMPLGQYWADTEKGWVEINEPIPAGFIIPNIKVERSDSRYWGCRVTYRAGFATEQADIDLGYKPVPEDLQIAVIATALSMVEGVPQSGPVNQQSIAGRQYSLKKTFSLVPDSVLPLLSTYAEYVF